MKSIADMVNERIAAELRRIKQAREPVNFVEAAIACPTLDYEIRPVIDATQLAKESQ